MWAIICDARKENRLGIKTVAYVNRKKTKEKWWVAARPDLIMKFYNKEIADGTCKKLKRNNPRVVPFRTAFTIMVRQRNKIKEERKKNKKQASIMPDCFLTQQVREEEKIKLKQRDTAYINKKKIW